MELRQLKYFSEVATTLHFGKAAEKLFVSQPALSQQIQLLEDELGLELFDRYKRKKIRKVELTEAGKFFAAEVRKILDATARAAELTKKIGHGEQSIRFGVYKTSLRESIVTLLKVFADNFPDVEVKIVEFQTFAEVQKAMAEGLLDFGISLLPLHDESLSSKILKVGHLEILLPEFHPLANEPYLTVNMLKDEKWVEISDTLNPYISQINLLFERNGLKRHIVQELPSLELLCSVVGMGVGIAFVPTLLDLSHFGQVVCRKLVNEDLSLFTDVEIEQALIYKDDRNSPLIKAMISFVN
ncbi:LysR family transcriptional regulator [Emticicia sp. CRIBPO]|uniref:LysR family transcriptional regulator n=1 Tax=Emticicia sp. CRIBPO TaxID=2683258 RepID=UPI0014124FBC|nr:LysR substrate-binding domain-containing protein [Emticicia sp. CRIBPO]NBA85368.1 LysR family transcriptional regulator [Emticicia sp. CRIBPO]